MARERLATYDTETAPALDWLDRRGLLVRVDGHNPPDTVERNLWRALQYFYRAHDGSLLADAWHIRSAAEMRPEHVNRG